MLWQSVAKFCEVYFFPDVNKNLTEIGKYLLKDLGNSAMMRFKLLILCKASLFMIVYQ